MAGCGGGAHSSTVADRTPASGELQAAAGYLGLSSTQLRSRLRLGETLGQVADTTPGHSAAGLQAAMLDAQRAALQRERLSPTVIQRRLRSSRERLRREIARSRRSSDLTLAARYLGTDPASLAAQLGTGQTLGQIASSRPGRSAAGLAAALIGPRASRLEAALREHQVTKAQEQAALSTLHKRVQRELDGSTHE